MLRLPRSIFRRSLQVKYIFGESTEQLPSSYTCLKLKLQPYSTIRLTHSSYERMAYVASKICHRIFGSNNLSWSQRCFSVMRLCENNPGVLQPVLDFKFVTENKKDIQHSIDARGLTHNVKELEKLYEKVKLYRQEVDAIDLEKKINSLKFNEMKSKTKQPNVCSKNSDKMFEELQEIGRLIRERLRNATRVFNEANDELIEAVLQLPNILDHETPLTDRKLVRQNFVSECAIPWNFQDYVAYHVADYEPSEFCALKSYQIPMFHSAEQETQLSVMAQRHLLASGFSETGMADTVRKSVLHSIGINTDDLLRLRESNAKTGDSHCSYLTGTSSLPSLLLLHSQTLIESSHVFPLRYFVIGRSYVTNKEGVARHNCVVQCLIACHSQISMDLEFQNLTNTMEDFYSTKVGIQKFQTQSLPARNLALYQRKKYVFVMNKTEKYPARVLGEISTIGDHLSKRLLCCFKDKEGSTKFIHFVHATFFDITNFLRANHPENISSPTSEKSIEFDTTPPAGPNL